MCLCVSMCACVCVWGQVEQEERTWELSGRWGSVQRQILDRRRQPHWRKCHEQDGWLPSPHIGLHAIAQELGKYNVCNVCISQWVSQLVLIKTMLFSNLSQGLYFIHLNTVLSYILENILLSINFWVYNS